MSESNMQKMQIPYTPTTEEVRDGWVEVQNAWWPGCPDNWDDLKAAEFDRWLTEVKAQTISDAIAYLKTTPAVTLTGKGGGYELLESYLMGEEQ